MMAWPHERVLYEVCLKYLSVDRSFEVLASKTDIKFNPLKNKTYLNTQGAGIAQSV
jgi:hypothetical protein